MERREGLGEAVHGGILTAWIGPGRGTPVRQGQPSGNEERGGEDAQTEGELAKQEPSWRGQTQLRRRSGKGEGLGHARGSHRRPPSVETLGAGSVASAPSLR